MIDDVEFVNANKGNTLVELGLPKDIQEAEV